MQWVGLELLCGTFCHTHKHTCTYTYPFKVTKRVKFDALGAGFVTIWMVTKCSVGTKHTVTIRVSNLIHWQHDLSPSRWWQNVPWWQKVTKCAVATKQAVTGVLRNNKHEPYNICLCQRLLKSMKDIITYNSTSYLDIDKNINPVWNHDLFFFIPTDRVTDLENWKNAMTRQVIFSGHTLEHTLLVRAVGEKWLLP